MKSGAFFPYRTVPAAGLFLSVDVDGADPVGNDPMAFDAHSSDSDVVTVRISVQLLDQAALDAAIPDGAEVLVGLRIYSVESRVRQLVPVEDTGDWTTLEFKRSDWTGNVEVSAVLTRTGPATLPDGFASDTGSVLCESAPVRIAMDPPEKRTGGSTLPVLWVDFIEDPRHSHVANHLFALVEQGDESGLPEIHLNTRFEGAFQILESKGHTGRKARIREAVFAQISHQTWTSVIGWALGELDRAVDAVPDSDEWVDVRAEMQPDWTADVLSDWAPKLLPAPETGDAIEDLILLARQGDLRHLLVEAVPDAIQSLLNTHGALTGMLKEINLLGTVD